MPSPTVKAGGLVRDTEPAGAKKRRGGYRATRKPKTTTGVPRKKRTRLSDRHRID